MLKTVAIAKRPGSKLDNLFNTQLGFQKNITGEAHLPKDSIEWASYHLLALQEEVGEVLKADKRWKTHRNEHYDPENKLEELADVFITTMNIAIFSGFSSQDVYNEIIRKIAENNEKLRRSRLNVR